MCKIKQLINRKNKAGEIQFNPHFNGMTKSRRKRNITAEK